MAEKENRAKSSHPLSKIVLLHTPELHYKPKKSQYYPIHRPLFDKIMA